MLINGKWCAFLLCFLLFVFGCNYICCMKKASIWVVGIVVGVCCLALILLQFSYFETMVDMRKEHFEESVRRSLYRTAYRLDMNEMRNCLSDDVQSDIISGVYSNGHYTMNHSYSTSGEDGGVVATFQMTATFDDPQQLGVFGNKGVDHVTYHGATLEDLQKDWYEKLKKRYRYYRTVLDEVVYNMLYQASELPIAERINITDLRNILGHELSHNGIDLPYNFKVVSGDGTVLYNESAVVDDDDARVYKELLFKNDPLSRTTVLEVSFPTSSLNKYIYTSVKFMIPSLLFTFVILITFFATLYMAIRHKKITEMKNDFINNMTHEFKTPISTISLAAQMLQDQSVVKSPEMFGRLSGVISSETKRLRFQVDKVLQMSMFENKNTASFKMKELDANDLVSGIVNTFNVKVEQNGGTIKSDLNAERAQVLVDEMHFTNVVFNLMDNAMKYKRSEVPLSLEVRTWNAGGKFMLSIKDNGIGVRKENLKKIFDKFYRVQTGNVHDVKGFGLGLAYVKQVVEALNGSIRAESEPGVGTEFVIVLPLK